MRNLRPLATAAGTGNGIGTLAGAGGSGGISQDQQGAELLRPHPGRQRQLPDRGVAGQLTAPVVRVRAAVRCQAPQPVQEQAGEVGLQVLDRHVGLRSPPHRQVHPGRPARPGEQRPRHPVSERLGLRIALIHRPPVEQRQDAHVTAPRRRREPPLRRPGRPVLGVLAERGFSRSREPNRLTPCRARNSDQTLTTRA